MIALVAALAIVDLALVAICWHLRAVAEAERERADWWRSRHAQFLVDCDRALDRAGIPGPTPQPGQPGMAIYPSTPDRPGRDQ